MIKILTFIFCLISTLLFAQKSNSFSLKELNKIIESEGYCNLDSNSLNYIYKREIGKCKALNIDNEITSDSIPNSFASIQVIKTNTSDLFDSKKGVCGVLSSVDKENITALIINGGGYHLNTFPNAITELDNLNYLSIRSVSHIPRGILNMKNLEYFYIPSRGPHSINSLSYLINEYPINLVVFKPLEIALLPNIKSVCFVFATKHEIGNIDIPELEFYRQLKPSIKLEWGYKLDNLTDKLLLKRNSIRKGKIKEGNFTLFYPGTSDTAIVGSIKNGKLDGEFRLFYRNKKIAQKRYYKNGKYVSTWRAYNLNGREVAKQKFEKNTQIDTYYSYRGNMIDSTKFYYSNDIFVRSISSISNDLKAKKESQWITEAYYNPSNGNIDSLTCKAIQLDKEFIIEKRYLKNNKVIQELFDEKGFLNEKVMVSKTIHMNDCGNHYKFKK